MSTYVHKRLTPLRIGSQRRPLSDVPEPPVALDAGAAHWWEALWRTPVAATWTASEQPVVTVLARLLDHLDGDISPGIAGQAANISAQLGLTPRSRRILSIEETEAPMGGVDERRREIRARVGLDDGEPVRLRAISDD